MVDTNAQLVVVISSTGYAARMVSKYRPAVPQVQWCAECTLRGHQDSLCQWREASQVLGDIWRLLLLAI